jgi:DNA-directed RNA polymerase specialized sigma24 family protein
MRGADDDKAAHHALDELCRQSWRPIHAFLRRRGIGEHEAEDLTQGFFQHLLSHDLMARAERERGRFRSFLLGCLKHYLDNQWQRDSAMRRGGHLTAVHLDALEPEARERIEHEALSTADDQVFDQAWARDVLDRTMVALRAEHADDTRFEMLAHALTGAEDRGAIMAATGMNEGAVKVAIHRLRKRYRELLKQAVAETVENDAEVDAELAHLVACLRR